MKKNTKFRSNNNTNLNYRFDSLSPAGKYCGTALDLIKRYNDLAKEAGSAGNYVEMEVFRQYAEHYRKIVTEINERKSLISSQKQKEQDETLENQDNQEASPLNDNAPASSEEDTPVLRTKPLSLKKRTLKIIEVTTAEPIETDEHASTQKSKQSHKRPLKKEMPVEQADVSEA